MTAVQRDGSEQGQCSQHGQFLLSPRPRELMREAQERHQRPSLEEEDNEGERDTIKFHFWKTDGPKPCKEGFMIPQAGNK